MRKMYGIIEYLHPRKLTCPLKRDDFNRKYILQPLIFRDMLVLQRVPVLLPEPRKSKSTKLCLGWYRQFLYIDHPKNPSFCLLGWTSRVIIIFKQFIYVNLQVPTFWGAYIPANHANFPQPNYPKHEKKYPKSKIPSVTSHISTPL